MVIKTIILVHSKYDFSLSLCRFVALLLYLFVSLLRCHSVQQLNSSTIQQVKRVRHPE